VLTEGRLEHRPRVTVVLPVHGLAAQQDAAEGVGDGQRVTAAAIAGAEPAFEVAAPEVVGREAIAEGHRVGRYVAPAMPAARKPGPGQDGATRAWRRPALVQLRWL